MTETPLVSAIIIFLNGETYLAEAIESILTQTCADWELLLVDDGSTDHSTSIARSYEARFPTKIRYLEHENHVNRGMSASRNLGIENAQSEFIAFLDADDIWLPRKLEEQVALMRRWPEAGMVYGRTQIWRTWDPAGSELDFFYPLGVEPNTLIEPPELLLHLLENKVQSPTTCNAMMRREVFERVGCFEPRFHGMFEDQVFFTKVELAFPVFVSSAFWARYRQHDQSECARSDQKEKVAAARKSFLGWVISYLESNHITDCRLYDIVHEQMRHYQQRQLEHVSSSAADFRTGVKQMIGRLLPAFIRRQLRATFARTKPTPS